MGRKVKTLNIRDSIGGNDRDDGDISFRLEGKDMTELRLAAAELKTHLNTIICK